MKWALRGGKCAYNQNLRNSEMHTRKQLRKAASVLVWNRPEQARSSTWCLGVLQGLKFTQLPDHRFVWSWLSNYLCISISECSLRLWQWVPGKPSKESKTTPLVSMLTRRPSGRPSPQCTLRTPLNLETRLLQGISWQSWMKTWPWSGKNHRTSQDYQGSTHRSNKYRRAGGRRGASEPQRGCGVTRTRRRRGVNTQRRPQGEATPHALQAD